MAGKWGQKLGPSYPAPPDSPEVVHFQVLNNSVIGKTMFDFFNLKDFYFVLSFNYSFGRTTQYVGS